MPLQKSEKIWHNGRFINWDDAQIHVLSHVIHYGSAVFEGIRCYELPDGPAIFRLGDHMQRMINSAKIYRMPLAYSLEELSSAAVELVRVNGMRHCYIRPITLRGYSELGVYAPQCPIETYMPAGSGGNISPAPTTAWTCASHPGIAWRPTPCRPWPRPRPIT